MASAAANRTLKAAPSYANPKHGQRHLSVVANEYPVPGTWPTPTVKGNYNKAGLSARSGDGLATAVARHTPGRLNPAWVAWLMGFPVGWTSCVSSATRASPSKPRTPFGC